MSLIWIVAHTIRGIKSIPETPRQANRQSASKIITHVSRFSVEFLRHGLTHRASYSQAHFSQDGCSAIGSYDPETEATTIIFYMAERDLRGDEVLETEIRKKASNSKHPRIRSILCFPSHARPNYLSTSSPHAKAMPHVRWFATYTPNFGTRLIISWPWFLREA